MSELRAIDPYLKIENLRWGWKYGMTPTLSKHFITDRNLLNYLRDYDQL